MTAELRRSMQIQRGTLSYLTDRIVDATTSVRSIREWTIDDRPGVVTVWLGLRWWAWPIGWLVRRRLHKAIAWQVTAGVRLVVTSDPSQASQSIRRVN